MLIDSQHHLEKTLVQPYLQALEHVLLIALAI